MSTKSIYLTTSVIAVACAALCFGQSPDEAATNSDISVFPKGDEKQGRIVFEVKNCHRCHTVEGAKFPEIDLPPIDNISLAGSNNANWTRDDYAHHIMDPQHLISPDHQKAMTIIGDRIGAETSPMPQFVDVLTVRDLIDVASFLEGLTK